MLTLFLAAYGAVLAAELVGDKLFYTTGVLATRYRSTPIVLGMCAAFMLKTAVAVMVGGAIAQLPRTIVAAATGASFVGVAYTLWRKPDSRPRAEPRDERASKAALVSFAAIFFSEWGDVGQITAATLAARYRSPLFLIWLGAVCAMVTKGVLAAFLGAGMRRWIRDRISPTTVRYVGVAALLGLGVAAVIEELIRGA